MLYLQKFPSISTLALWPSVDLGFMVLLCLFIDCKHLFWSICSALLCPTSPVLSPRSLRVGGQCPHPPTASLAGRSLIPHVHAQHPLLPPVFSRFGLVLTPQLSHKFSHLCLQTSLLSSKRRIKRIKRDEIWTAPGTEPSLQPELGTQLHSANTC